MFHIIMLTFIESLFHAKLCSEHLSIVSESPQLCSSLCIIILISLIRKCTQAQRAGRTGLGFEPGLIIVLSYSVLPLKCGGLISSC